MTTLRQEELAPSSLLLDPNNYRFQESEEFVYAAEDRFHEATVQFRAYQRLKGEGIQDLKRSIVQNGYIPVERIVVRRYGHSSEDKYLIIEGNRRVAAVKWILEDHDAGVAIRDVILRSVAKLPVLLVENGDSSDDAFVASLMGIRHVSGIKEWGGYQRAKLIVHMRDSLNLDAGEVAERLALSVHEVNRRYRAFKTLQQMQIDEEYGPHATPAMYPIFHEAVSLPMVREWLQWDDGESRFTDTANLERFYTLITPSRDDDSDRVTPAAITTYMQVRHLRDILPRPDAKRALLDTHHSIDKALALAKRDETRHEWVDVVRAAIGALRGIGVQELKQLTEEDRQLIDQVRALAGERLRDHQLLIAHQES